MGLTGSKRRVRAARAAIEADVASIATAHILIPAYEEERLATLSPAIVDGLLKKRWDTAASCSATTSR
jgi:beta-glucosidase-like glycosyl hydrolase